MQNLLKKIRIIKDFPKAGIGFFDITTLLKDAAAFDEMLGLFAAKIAPLAPDFIAGVESRGFIIAAPLAARLGVGFVPIRKPRKLPAPTLAQDYELEYGSDRVELHRDAFCAGFSEINALEFLRENGGYAAGNSAQISPHNPSNSNLTNPQKNPADPAVKNPATPQKPRVVLVDDLIATGGTAWASAQLVRQAGGELLLSCFLIELAGLCDATQREEIGEIYSLILA